MTDEIKTEEQPVPASEVPQKKSKQELHKEKQGKKKTSKKKVKSYTKVECLDELKRLERTGHQQSDYYIKVRKRALSLP